VLNHCSSPGFCAIAIMEDNSNVQWHVRELTYTQDVSDASETQVCVQDWTHWYTYDAVWNLKKVLKRIQSVPSEDLFQ
jgi:hypothetical protein